ncbi:zinc ribbon domain-containing protein [Pseudomonas aeruginosa]|uniref:zinc ribbon domain-containing protein n=1 Tax=Pseudomonas aeruginosa TaxID=287 RepID=UPI0021AD9644|nr:zinc ribbon domain-containing protein [Pseudomonas aeruginosa]
MSSTQHQLIEQCATRLRGIVEALDNIHDTSPHRWSTDLDDVHSSAESLLAMIKDQAPTQAAQGLAGAALAQPSLMPPDRGPWHAVKWDGGRRVDLSSDDFEHDVALTVSGDFVEGDKFRYAQELAAWMNAHLAQPSPVQAEQHWPKLEKPAQVGGVRFSAGVSSRLVVEAAQRLYEFESTPEQEAERIERLQAFREQLDPLNLAPHAEAFNEAPAEALKPEQAEAERPEVVAWQYRVTAGPQTGWSLWHPGKGEEFERSYTVERRPLMTVAQYERITAKLHDALDESDGDRWKMRSERDAANARLHEVATACATAEQERDAALAEVERLRQFERICEGLPQDAIDGGWTAQGIRGYAKRLEDQLKAALAQVEALRAELQSQRERNTELIFKLGSATNGWGRCEKERDAALARVAELKTMSHNYCALLMDANAKLAELEKQEPINLQHMAVAADGELRWMTGRKIDNCELYAMPDFGQAPKLYAAPVAQAQHSVPEISGIGRDAEHPRAVVLYLRNEPSEEDMRAIQNFLRAISADVLTQAQHSAGYAEARMCANCRHIGINDAADYAACHDCNWTGPEPDEDKCPGCAGENCMAAACPECGCRYDLVAEANITAPAGQVPQAWLDVQAERRRQITAEGWTPEHDDEHDNGEMARAAACYALAGSSAPSDGTAALLVSLAWPWDEQWWKPSTARRDMVKACALGLAEIERLDRVAASQGGPSDA